MDTPSRGSNSQGGCPGSPGFMESGCLYANLGAEVSGGSGVQGNGSGCGLAGVSDPWAAYLNGVQRQGQQNMAGQHSSVPSSSSGGCMHHAAGGCLRHGGCLPQGQGGCLSQDPGGCWSRGFVTQPGVSLSGQGQGLARTAYDLSHSVQERSQGVPVYAQGSGGDPVIVTHFPKVSR